MRTTLDIDDDVLDRARALTLKTGLSFKQAINKALRAGLDVFVQRQKSQIYKTVPTAMKLKEGHSLDNISELLAQIEGEEHK